MPSNTIFISYSRKDTEFMTKFSKNLREAGAKLWSDKQIVPGGLWDNSIETALATCDVIIVLISNSSVNSNNVMDEVSFALEENKKVIPVLLEKCELPFRLRRIQFIDLSENYEKGMNLLKSTLDLKVPSSAEQPHSTTVVKEKGAIKTSENPEPKKNIIEKKVEKSNVNIEPKAKSKRKIFKISLSVFMVIGSYFVFALLINPAIKNNKVNKENENLIIEQPTDSIVHTPIKTDDSEWELVKNSNKIGDYESHMSVYSNCIHKEDATSKIIALTEVIEEDNLYNNADTYLKMLNYITTYGKDGTHYNNALTTIDTYFNSNGFVQYSASNGTRYFELLFNNPENLPAVGDLIVANSARNIHKGPLNSPTYYIVNHTTSNNEVFKVKNIEKVGSAYWVHVTFL